VLSEALRLLDREKCDIAVFSLFTLEPRPGFSAVARFEGLRHIRTVLVEEFLDGPRRNALRFVAYHRADDRWQEYSFRQCFGSLSDVYDDEVEEFVQKELPARIMGNVCVLLCGESNGVNYSPSEKRVQDYYKLRAGLPDKVQVILNPVHDRMTRFEMEKKRSFLSKPDRLLISVWNKGKLFRNRSTGKRRPHKEPLPAWSVFQGGRRVEMKSLPNDLGVEIGIVDVAPAHDQ
jgi:enamine deaminase RidA (YjgF/YER057c/UK114 family)